MDSRIAQIRDELALINPRFRALNIVIDTQSNLVKLGQIEPISRFENEGEWVFIFLNNSEFITSLSSAIWELRFLLARLRLEGAILIINKVAVNIVPSKKTITSTEVQDLINRFLAKLDSRCLRILGNAKFTLNQGELKIELIGLKEFVFIVENRYQVFQALSDFDLINCIKLVIPDRSTKIPLDYQDSLTKNERFSMNKQISNIKALYGERIQKYRNILKGFCNERTTVYLIDAESLVYLDIAVSNSKRLNRSQDLLIGNSFDINDPSIGDPRRYWCSKAYADGENKRFCYSYRDPDNNLLWHFESRVIFLPGEPNLICTVTDPIEADWQTQYWLNLQPTRSSEA